MRYLLLTLLGVLLLYSPAVAESKAPAKFLVTDDPAWRTILESKITKQSSDATLHEGVQFLFRGSDANVHFEPQGLSSSRRITYDFRDVALRDALYQMAMGITDGFMERVFGR